PSVAGIFLGALFANRLAGKMPIPKQALIGFAFLIGASLFNVGYHLYFPPALPWSVAPLFFYTFGMSIVAPGATLLVLDLFPRIRGIVASCQSFTLTMLAAVVSAVIAPILSQSVLWLAEGQLTFTLIGLGCWLVSRSYRNFRKSQPTG
ncbi:MAG TPA: Bcr/CflA family drug resistance efflux transporter, partial [Burkholderiaceae bacterium]|nr:Bcr/CflA family drug resistance efflux transporter [Burkholderiaceae bacterium]